MGRKSQKGRRRQNLQPSRLGDLGGPTGLALEVTLKAGARFYESVSYLERPVTIHKNADGQPSDTSKLSMDDWSKSEDLLHWFKAGCSGDPEASLSFSPALSQSARAAVHKQAERLGLDSFSKGFGDERHITLYAKGAAPTKPAVVDEASQRKAKILHLLAKAGNIKTSRDELTEMLASDSLPENLQQLWDSKGKEQLALVRLNLAASRGNVDDLKAAIAETPEVVKSGQVEVSSTLTPLNCAAAQNHPECVQLLIDAGAPLEAVDGFGLTPLMASRKFENMDTEAVLLRAGAEDTRSQEMFSRDISVASSPPQADPAEPPPASQPAAGKASRFSLENALHAKPFVPSSQAKGTEADEEYSKQQQLQPGEANLDTGVIGEGRAAEAQDREGEESGDARGAPAHISHQPVRSSFGDAGGEPIRVPDEPGNASQLNTANGGKHLAMGRTLSSSNLPEGLRRGSPNLKDDPQAATRGVRGASAVALGRRIMQSASPGMKRYGSVGQMGELDAGADGNKSVQPPTRSQSGNLLSWASRPQSGQRLMGDKVHITMANKRPEHGWKDSRQRIDAWMESAQEEHSQSLSSAPSDAESQHRPPGGNDPPEPSSPSAGPGPNARIGKPKLSVFRESEENVGSRSHSRRQSRGELPSASEPGTPSSAKQLDVDDELSSAALLTKGKAGASSEDAASRPPADAAPGPSSPDAEDKKPGGNDAPPKQQDPRGAAFPSAPPQASGAATEKQNPEGVQQPSQPLVTKPEETKPKLEKDGSQDATTSGQDEAKSKAISSLPSFQRRPRAAYVEGTQAPEVATDDIAQVPGVVGGRAVADNDDDNLARTATYGEQGESAVEAGKQVMKDAEAGVTSETKTGLAGVQDHPKYQEPSNPPKGTADSLSAVPHVVGGQALLAERHRNDSNHTSLQAQASGGGVSSESPANNPLEEGEATTAIAPSAEEDPVSAANLDLDVAHSGAPLRNTPSMARISEEAPRASASAAGDRPKGLGSSPGLPSKKRPGSAKPRTRNVRPRESEERGKVGSGAEGRSVDQPKPFRETRDTKEQEPQVMSAIMDWVEKNSVVLLAGFGIASAAFAAFCWIRRR